MDDVHLSWMYRLLYPGTWLEMQNNHGRWKVHLPIEPESMPIGTLICQYIQVLVINTNLYPPNLVQRMSRKRDNNLPYLLH